MNATPEFWAGIGAYLRLDREAAIRSAFPGATAEDVLAGELRWYPNEGRTTVLVGGVERECG